MVVIGVDLSGPSNSAETAMACFCVESERLKCKDIVVGLDDAELYRRIEAFGGESEIVIGLDAPLSYYPGGGDRPGDAELRRRLINAGLHPGSVMPPTMTRMVYLTLRGVCVARGLKEILPNRASIVEVHPAGAMVLRGAPSRDVREFKRDPAARGRLLGWLGRAQKIQGIPRKHVPTDHVVAAMACALAAWNWARNQPAWCQKADPPIHPYDFAC